MRLALFGGLLLYAVSNQTSNYIGITEMGLITNQNHMLEDWNLQSKGIYDFDFTSKSDPRSGYSCDAKLIL